MKKADKSSGKAFESYARSLISGDRKSLISKIAELIASGGQDDCEKIAAILSFSTVGGDGDRDYYSARYGSSFDKRYLDLFIKLCKEGGIPESDYIKVLLAAGSADKSTALYRWNSAVNVYLTRRAAEDFNLVADYIDMYDRKYTKYDVLIRKKPMDALERLVAKVIYGKNVDKTAIRDVLMDHGKLAAPLISLYNRSNAKERAAIARLLLLYKNDAKVKSFIEETIATDKSKTVRDVLPRAKSGGRRSSAVSFFENTMACGEMYPLSKWRELFKKESYAEVADKTFFFKFDDREMQLLIYNEGEFLDLTDTPVPLERGDMIGVLHPIDMPSDSDLLLLNIEQPFKQISRKIFFPTRDGRSSNVLSGTLVSREQFDDCFKKLRFVLCGKRTAREKDVALKIIGKYAVGVECDFSEASDTVACGGIKYYRAEDVVKLNKTYYVSSVGSIPSYYVSKREFSELTLAAHRLFGREC